MNKCEHCGCTETHINKTTYADLATNLDYAQVDFREIILDRDSTTGRAQVWFVKDETDVLTPYYLEQQDDLTWVIKEDPNV